MWTFQCDLNVKTGSGKRQDILGAVFTLLNEM